MKTTFTTATLVLLALVFAANANADIVGTISTDSADNWTVRYAGNDANISVSSLAADWSPAEGKTVYWKDELFNGEVAPKAWEGAGEWITVPKGDYVPSTYRGNRYDGAGQNGVYVFDYSFSLNDLNVNYEDLNYFSLALDVLVDDSLLGILLNGNSIYNDVNQFFEKDGTISTGRLDLTSEKLGDILEYLYADESNVLSFIVKNSGETIDSNPVGISLDGNYLVTYDTPSRNEDGEIVIPPPYVNTPVVNPEPGTMLIFGLGMAGAGIAAMRRRGKRVSR